MIRQSSSTPHPDDQGADPADALLKTTQPGGAGGPGGVGGMGSTLDGLEHIAEEILAAFRADETIPSLEELVERYPDHEDTVRRLLPTILAMEDFGRSGTALPDQTDRKLGDFRIVREVGRGGMGVVLEAWQESLDRHVALKILPTQAVLDPRLLARFQREARAAAGLQHPHIVPVYGIGETRGVHYYAMQFIEGDPLDRVMNRLAQTDSVVRPGSSTSFGSRDVGQRSSTSMGGPEQSYYRRVAEIGRQVASAMAYAHGEGVLHRDLKPSNLLLDREGKVWVTDFGLAKIESEDRLTQTGDVLGTPRYMAPEALRGWSDPRTDVYGLGITLYELATQQNAFEGLDRQRLLLAIEHETPLAPRRVRKSIPRDLETILLTAIHKDPQHRYGSAEAMQADLDRFIARQPIRARRATWRYRAGLFVSRHRAAVALSVVLLAAFSALLGGWAVSVQRERNDAVAAREHSHANFTVAINVIDEMLTEFSSEDLAVNPAWEAYRLKVYERAVRMFDELRQSNPDSAEVRKRSVKAHVSLARLQSFAGDEEQSIKTLKAALAMCHGPDSDAQRLKVLENLATGYLMLPIGGRGEVFLEQLESLIREIQADPERLQNADASVLAGAFGRLAHHALGRSERSRAREFLAEAADIVDRIPASTAQDPGVASELLALARVRAGVAYEFRDCAAVHQRVAEARAKFGILEQHGVATTWARYELCTALRHGASALEYEGKIDEAAALLRESLDLIDRIVEAAPKFARFRVSRAGSWHRLSRIHRHRDEIDQAIEFLERSYQDYVAADALSPLLVPHHLNLVETLNQLGINYRSGGQLEESAARHRTAIAECKSILEEYEPEPRSVALLGDAYSGLGIVLRQLRQLDEAEEAYREGIRALASIPSRARKLEQARILLRTNLSTLMVQRGKSDEARALLQEALERCTVARENYPETMLLIRTESWIYTKLAGLLPKDTDPKQVLGMHRKAIALDEELHDRFPGQPRYASSLAAKLHNLAHFLGADEESEGLLRKAIDLQKIAVNANSSNRTYRKFLSNHYNTLALVLLRSGRWQEALEYAPQVTECYPGHGSRHAKVARIYSLAASQADPAQREDSVRLGVAELAKAVELGFRQAEFGLGSDYSALSEDPEGLRLIELIAAPQPKS